MTVDVDSADVWLARALLTAGFRPRVMLIEYNYMFAATSLAFPDPSWMPHTTESEARWKGSCYWGSSAAAILAVMRPFGYVLANSAQGLDLVFVRGDQMTNMPHLSESILLAMHEGLELQEYSLNLPMTREDASSLVDFNIIANGGSVCAARQAAAATIRSLASRR